MNYSSKRAFLLVGFAFVFMAALAWDRGWGSIGDLIAILSHWAKTAGLTWLSTFLERLSADLMTLGMVIVLLVVVFYGLVQYIGALSDGRQVANSAEQGMRAQWRLAPRKIVLWLSGRPAGSIGSFLRDEKLREIHFGYGRHVLLAPLRLALWAFPVVGFLGTVMGISGAVARLPQVLEDTQQLNLLLSNLHVAFDTTFIGLAASLFIMALLHVVEALWDRNELIASIGHSVSADAAPGN